MGKNIETWHFVAQTSWGNHCNRTLLWLLISLPQSIARSLVQRPWCSFVQFDRNRIIIVCRCPRWVLILNVPFQHDLSAWEMELQKTDRHVDVRTESWIDLFYVTHTQVLYYSQILLFRLIRTHSEQPQNKLMLQFKMYVVGYYIVKGARIAIASLYNTFNELMHPTQ